MYIVSLVRDCVVFSVLFYGYACSIFLTSLERKFSRSYVCKAWPGADNPPFAFLRVRLYIHIGLCILLVLQSWSGFCQFSLAVCKGSFLLFLRVSLKGAGVWVNNTGQ